MLTTSKAMSKYDEPSRQEPKGIAEDHAATQILDTIRQVHSGRSAFRTRSPQISRAYGDEPLTNREVDVLRMVSKEIGIGILGNVCLSRRKRSRFTSSILWASWEPAIGRMRWQLRQDAASSLSSSPVRE